MDVSFAGFNEKNVTFISSGTINAGDVVKISASGTVAACSEDDVFCGVCTEVRDGFATVQLCGYTRVAYSGNAPSVGYSTLLADGDGGVAVDEDGRAVLVIDVDSTGSTVGIML